MDDEPDNGGQSTQTDPRCPDCGAPAMPIQWGLPVGNPGPDVILGGCVIYGAPDSWGCRECGWRGGAPAGESERS